MRQGLRCVVELWKTPWGFKYFKTFFCSVFCILVSGTARQRELRGHVFTPRLGERGIPRVAHGATATMREEGDRKWREWMEWVLPACQAASWAHRLMILCEEYSKSVRGMYSYSHFTDEKIETWHPRSHTQHTWSLSLCLSDWESQAFFLYTVCTNILCCSSFISETFFY